MATLELTFQQEALEAFAGQLYQASGMDAEKAASVAHLQVLTDAMGRATHGLAMAPLYLAEIANGQMAVQGEPLVVSDGEVSAVWDGRYLPGLWLVKKAIDSLMPRASKFGMAAVAIRCSHHIGCLAALVKQAADQGFIALLANSDPSGQRVAPFGGKKALFTPNPLAFAYPLESNSVLMDICASVTTVSMTRQKFAQGELFDQPWLLDADGRPTRNPAVLEHDERPGSIQLLGGQDSGHKGFGLALMIEALSQGLSGHGRKQEPKRWGGNVFIQLIDADRFAGRDAFAQQAEHLASACRSNPPIDARRPVRLPGDQAASQFLKAQKSGVSISTNTWQNLSAWAQKLQVELPQTVSF
jgi:LDH2 family malate/lactate/ureidoglycolate dehydrogenase